MSDVNNLFVRYLRYASPFEGGRGMISKKSSPFVWIPVFFGCTALSKEGQLDNALNPDNKTSMVGVIFHEKDSV